MRDIAQQQSLSVDQGFQTLRHVVEVVDKSVKFISAKNTWLRWGRLFYTSAELARSEFPGGFPQANHWPSENQDQDESGEAADGNSNGQLRKCEVEKIAIPCMPLPIAGKTDEVDIFLA